MPQVKIEKSACFQEACVARESSSTITGEQASVDGIAGEQISTKKFTTLGVVLVAMENNDIQSLQEGYYGCGQKNMCAVNGIYKPLTGEYDLTPSCLK